MKSFKKDTDQTYKGTAPQPTVAPKPTTPKPAYSVVDGCKFISAQDLFASKITVGKSTMILVTKGQIKVGESFITSFDNPNVLVMFRPDDQGWNEATNYISSKV